MSQPTNVPAACDNLPSADSAAVRSEYEKLPQVARVLAEYVAGLPNHVALMTRAMAASDRGNLRRLAHQLRGTGGSYGFPGITQLAGDAESAIDNGSQTAEVVAAVDALVGLLRRVEGYDRSAEILRGN